MLFFCSPKILSKSTTVTIFVQKKLLYTFKVMVEYNEYSFWIFCYFSCHYFTLYFLEINIGFFRYLPLPQLWKSNPLFPSLALSSFKVPKRISLSIPWEKKKLYQGPFSELYLSGGEELDFLDSDKYKSLFLKLLLCPSCGNVPRND